ncbi:hypothetical protein Adu01nite_89720 [Paractinoplanes durhamensis]|uniref:Mannosyltransferase (PIG-V) n=2 Tax=Paractinoplanes durhamensis TaxID=113563 RepID=A0ABQ3ZCS1_9ACTN|nr:hypothetical protein Adu01nite_89720 [Actinoplanes durhamensis]
MTYDEPSGWRQRLAPWRPALVAAFGSWLAANVAYVVASVYTWRVTKTPAPGLPDIGNTWHHQDATFYTQIAERGYHANPDSVAFYPLYPITVRVVDWVLPGRALIAAFAVTTVCAYLLLVVMFRLVETEFDTRVAGRSIAFLAAFPTAFFLFGAYNESMFVLLCVASLYAARRSNFWLAGAFAGLAGGTRLFGLLLAVPVAWEYLRQRDGKLGRIRWDVLSFGLMPLGLIAYMIYCKVSWGNWLAFVDAQKHWDRQYTWPGHALWDGMKAIGGMPWLNEWHTLTLFEVAATLFAIVLTVLGFVGPWKFRKDQYYLLLATVLPLLLTNCTIVGNNRWLMSAPRFVLEYTAIFIVLARIGKSPAFEKVYIAAGYMLQALMLATFLLDVTFVA